MTEPASLEEVNEYTGESPAAALRVVAGQDAAPKISDKTQYDTLPDGSEFIDPEGNKRIKPYRPKTREDYAALPDGAHFTDPEGELREKPRYQSIDFTAQALYDNAHSDKGRRAALERSYPGKVKDDPAGGFYVDDDGVLRKPGRGVSAVGGAIANAAFPTILGGIGSLLGGATGSLVEPGGGTLIGGAAGGYGGSYMGQRINDIVASLAGVYDPEGGEQNARMAGYMGAAGDVGGRAISAVAPTVKAGAQAIERNLAKAANKFLGTDKEALETGLKIAESAEKPGTGLLGKMGMRGTDSQVSPTAIFKGSPHAAGNIAEVLAQKFDQSSTYREQAERFMDKRAREILAHKDIGTLVEDSLVHPKAAVATEEAGSLLKDSARLRAVDQAAEADKKLAEVLANRRAEIEAKYAPDIETYRARNDTIIRSAEQAKAAADNLVQEGLRDIERQADDAVRVAQVGHNAGDLWRSVAESFVALRRSVAQRSNRMYADANTMSNGLVPAGAQALASRAQALLDQLPEGFAGSHPTIVRRIAAMAGEENENGEVVRAPIAATWSELHELRTMIRQDIKWNDVTSDVKNGALKYMQNGIDEVLHSVENQPELREASRLLRLADDFYRENMGPLNSQQIKSLVKALDSGLQADPKALLKIAIQDGKTEVANTIRNTVGPTTWNAVRAADVQEMLAQSRLLDGSIDGLKFAKQVEDRYQNRVLGVLHGEDGARRLQQQAVYIQQLRGKLPIAARPGDTANDIILRARTAAAEAERKADADPLRALQNEMKKVEAATRKEFAATQKQDPLGFLNDSTVGANEAVDRILKNPDLIVAAARTFPGGERSPEFQLMRQVWTERFLRETLEPGERLAKVSPEVQQLMFPGITLDDMHMLAKEMKLLMSGKGMDFGGSLLAQTAVENPIGHLSGLGKLAKPIGKIPVLGQASEAGARGILTVYYNTVRELLTSPSTLRWLKKGLMSRDPESKAAARAELLTALQRGGAIGTSTAESTYQGAPYFEGN